MENGIKWWCLVKGAVQTYINKHCRSELIGESEKKKAELLQGMALQFNVTRNTHYTIILAVFRHGRKWYDFSGITNT